MGVIIDVVQWVWLSVLDLDPNSWQLCVSYLLIFNAVHFNSCGRLYLFTFD